MYSQRDTKWLNHRLGKCKTSIGLDGCLICCLAECLRGTESEMTPAELNKWLTKNRGYFKGCRLIFSSVRPLGLRLVTVGDYRYSPAPVPMIRDYIEKGMQVLLEVDWMPDGPYQEHWVKAERVEGETIIVSDPWLLPSYQMELDILKQYGKRGWDLARLITGYAVYTWEGVDNHVQGW